MPWRPVDRGAVTCNGWTGIMEKCINLRAEMNHLLRVNEFMEHAFHLLLHIMAQ